MKNARVVLFVGVLAVLTLLASTGATVKTASAGCRLLVLKKLQGDGSKKVFMIRRYSEVEIDPGPAIDMFGGMIPLETGDYSVTTEVTEHAPPPPVEGRAPLAFNGDFLLVEGRFADGRTGTFIVDFGAGGTVTGFLGNAVLDELTFGDAGFEGVTVRVIDEMPPFADTEIAGILGLDLLRRGGVVSFGYGADAVLSWGDEAATSAIDVPFRTAANHIFIDGIVDGVKADVAREFKGLDGHPIPARTATVGQFTLGPAALGERRFYEAPLAVFDGMGLAQSGVLLGNDFLKEFRSVQVDFARDRVRLLE